MRRLAKVAVTIITLLLLASMLSWVGCAHQRARSSLSEPIELSPNKNDDSYGYSAENPIRVGGGQSGGPGRSKAFLSSLRGPEGQAIEFMRQGSCCKYNLPESYFGFGLLDSYLVTYEGLKKSVTLYIDIYVEDEPKPPLGLKQVGK